MHSVFFEKSHNAKPTHYRFRCLRKKRPLVDPVMFWKMPPRPPCSMLALVWTNVFYKIGRLFRRRHTLPVHASTLNFGGRGSQYVWYAFVDRAFFSQTPDSWFDRMHCKKEDMITQIYRSTQKLTTHDIHNAHTHTHTHTQHTQHARHNTQHNTKDTSHDTQAQNTRQNLIVDANWLHNKMWYTYDVCATALAICFGRVAAAVCIVSMPLWHLHTAWKICRHMVCTKGRLVVQNKLCTTSPAAWCVLLLHLISAPCMNVVETFEPELLQKNPNNACFANKTHNNC